MLPNGSSCRGGLARQFPPVDLLREPSDLLEAAFLHGEVGATVRLSPEHHHDDALVGVAVLSEGRRHASAGRAVTHVDPSMNETRAPEEVVGRR